METLKPGWYRSTDKNEFPAWTEFELTKSGQVTFVDAGDGHLSFYSKHAEWEGHMLEEIKAGRLVYVGQDVCPDSRLRGGPKCKHNEKEERHGGF